MLNVYWEYAGTRYKQKLRAINASHGDIMNISFHGFKSFQSFDWSKEPSQSLNELMLTRALMLRDTYKYIKFWYSPWRWFVRNVFRAYRRIKYHAPSDWKVERFLLPW